MKGLEFSIMRYGYLHNDLAWNAALLDPASKSNQNKQATYMRFPCSMILIRHPEEGYILYDVGDYPPSEPDAEARPAYWDEYFALEANREDFVDRQLEKIGLSVGDISCIIMSHMHCDHANGLKFFSGTRAGQNIYVSKPDFVQACVTTLCEDGERDTKSPYWRSIMTIPGLKYHFVEEDTELFKGVHVFMLEGHTPGVLGLRLELESGSYLFPSDACASALNYGPPAVAPGIIYDSLGYVRCIQKLYALQKKHGAHIIFSHDPEQDESCKHFPEFYR